MTRETAQKLWEVIKAFGEGNEVQTFDGGQWHDIKAPYFHEGYDYRIKPREPREFTAKIYPNGGVSIIPNPGHEFFDEIETIRVREILPDETP